MPRNGSRHVRGYGYEHTKVRAAWAPIVAAGEAHCHEPICIKRTRWIRPGEPWDLGHTPDRTAWTGPCHRACNRREGAVRGNHQRRRTTIARITRTSRDW